MKSPFHLQVKRFSLPRVASLSPGCGSESQIVNWGQDVFILLKLFGWFKWTDVFENQSHLKLHFSDISGYENHLEDSSKKANFWTVLRNPAGSKGTPRPEHLNSGPGWFWGACLRIVLCKTLTKCIKLKHSSLANIMFFIILSNPLAQPLLYPAGPYISHSPSTNCLSFRACSCLHVCTRSFICLECPSFLSSWSNSHFSLALL